MNAAKTSLALSMAVAVAIAVPLEISAQNVLTYQNDNARDGANTNEVSLTPANVNSNLFGRLFTCPVDGYVYAEPLYVSNLAIPGQGTHNVVFLATENDSVYAFDADSNGGPNGGLLWQTNLGIAATSIDFGVRYHHNVLNPLIGITGTPVIDAASGTLYVDVFSGDVPNTTNCVHRIHALDITTGADRPYSPVLVQASVPGTGVASSNGVVTFVPNQHMNRPALTLAGGILYVCYGSYGDTDPYHGWVIGYDATNLRQLTNYVFATTPNATMSAFGTNAGEGALWMGGGGLCVDASNNLYLESGNGSFSANTNGADYGDCFVKLSASNQLAVADYFAPSNQASMAANDLDLGSGSPMLLPDSAGSATHPHLIVGAGKEGTIYLIDRDAMGQYSANSNYIVQTATGVMGGVWGSPAYFDNLIFYQGVGDVLKAFRITNGVMGTTPVSKSTTSFGGVGYTPCISANGTGNAIAWVIRTDTTNSVLHAYNATNLAIELYNSSQNLARDNPGKPVKYAAPVVANGKVYVRGQYTFAVYGLLPVPSLAVVLSAGSVVLSWPTNTSLTYMVEGSTNLLTGNWSVITNAMNATNGVFRVSIPATGTASFYRLKH